MQACGLPAEWHDIHANPDVLKGLGVGQEEVRKKLYVVDAGGNIRAGADAFATLWQQTPGQRLLGRVIALPVFRVLARAGYNLFAVILYRWNKAKGRW
jgi:predicted DCC family thiol-disulfide oxidoreductase YuxK